MQNLDQNPLVENIVKTEIEKSIHRQNHISMSYIFSISFESNNLKFISLFR